MPTDLISCADCHTPLPVAESCALLCPACLESVTRPAFAMARLVPRFGGIRLVQPVGTTDPVKAARLAGYEGEPCPCCKQLKRVRSGDLWACDGCGTRGRLEE